MGGKGRKRERGQIGGGVELCLIGGERHSLDGSGVDLEFKWLASLSLSLWVVLSLSGIGFLFFIFIFFSENDLKVK